jgi:TolB-like protein/Flp pilus assembly protein TadD
MNDAADGLARLSSWKEIAAHLRVSIRTAQRWSEAENLPTRRHRTGAQGSVFAYRSELDSWLANRPHLREPASADVPAPSIAVLPFIDLNRNEENEIFADGLTEELINGLAQVEGLRVVARTSVFHFKGKTGDTRAIAVRLGVRTLLEGSVRRSEDRLRITAQLIDAADGCQLWSQCFDRRLRGMFEIQEEIARSIVDVLRIKFAGGRITRKYEGDPQSYTLYLEGRHQWNRRTQTGIRNAVECFTRLVARDPGIAPAWAALADCYAMLPAYGEMPAGEALRRARSAAEKALAIDDALSEAHTALAFVNSTYEFDWAGAETRFRRALDLNPNNAYAHLLYAAMVLAPTGRLDEAVTQQQRACDLDPLSAVTMSGMGAISVMLQQFDDAIAASRRALELDPGYPWAHRWMGEAFLLKGLYDEAELAFSAIETPAFGAGFLGYCYARTHRVPEAAKLLLHLEKLTANCPMLALQVAVIHLGLDNLDMALNWLHKACDTHAPGVHWLMVEPIWDALRPDPRFGQILRRLRLDA